MGVSRIEVSLEILWLQILEHLSNAPKEELLYVMITSQNLDWHWHVKSTVEVHIEEQKKVEGYQEPPNESVRITLNPNAIIRTD